MEVNFLANAICETIRKYRDGGLVEVPLPTGFGKTHAVMQAISMMTNPDSEYYDDGIKRFIFTTTLKKNLPYEKLKQFYIGDFDKDVLLLKSNVDSLIDFYDRGGLDYIPEIFKNEDFLKMRKRLEQLKRLSQKNKEQDNTDFIQDLRDNLNLDEQNFRKNIRSILHGNFRSSLERICAIKNDKEYKWIGELYPYVFIGEKKVVFVTMRKLLLGLSPLVGSGNSLLDEFFLENTVLFIDEYDATKQDAKDEIIETQLNENIDLIRAFRSIHSVIHSDRFSSDLLSVLEGEYDLKRFFDGVKLHADGLYDFFKLGFSYKQKVDSVDRTKSFLFYDSQFQTILEKGKNTIYAKEDTEKHRMTIFKASKVSSSETYITVQDLLRKVDAFMKRFSYLVWRWANAYMIQVNQERKRMIKENGIEYDMMTVDNAAYTIIGKFLSDKDEKKVVCGYYSKMDKRSQLNSQRMPYSYFSNGFTMFALEDNDANNDDTIMSMTKIKDTPESLMAFVANHALVFAISATSGIPSATGNYCRDFLKDTLGAGFHVLTEENKELKSYIIDELKKRNQPYSNGDITVDVNNISEDDEIIKSNLTELFADKETLQLCINSIELETSKLGEDKCVYYASKYLRLLYVIRSFACNVTQQTLLYLGKALPKNSDGSTMKNSVLEYMIEAVNKDAELDGDNAIDIAVLNGNNFEESKRQICERLRKGQKLIIFSSYQTVGAGQNLQYPISDKYRPNLVYLPHNYSTDKEERDIDSIYLDDITYLTENLRDLKHFGLKENLRHLMQVMECYGNYEISTEDKRSLVKAGFNSLQNISPHIQASLYDTKSIKLQVTRDVIQAIGRMGRTFVRNKHITIHIYDKVLNTLDKETLFSEFNSPEVKALGEKAFVSLSLQEDEKFVLCRANTISVQVASKIINTVRRSFKGAWSDNDIRLWKELREMTLKYPTASEDDYKNNELIRGYYINGLQPISKYLYSTNDNSFRNIHVWFGDEQSFKNSKQLIPDERDKLIIHKCSQEDARLQQILKFKGTMKMFEEKGYATTFSPNKYIMSPALYNNIYKGALGEVAGRYILEQSTSLNLKDIEDGSRFEYFDFEVDGEEGVYVDFKHWNSASAPYNDRDQTDEEIRSKMDRIGAKKVFIIGVLKDSDSEPSKSADGRIITIPYLIDKNGNVAKDMIKQIEEA